MIFSYPKLLNGKPSYDHEEALKRLYASQERRNVKNHQPKIEESGKSEHKRDVESFVVESAAPVAGKPDGVPVVDIPVDADVPANDDAVIGGFSDPYLDAVVKDWQKQKHSGGLNCVNT